MKGSRAFCNIILTIIMILTFSQSTGIAKSLDNNTHESDSAVQRDKANDGKMVITPKYNCDPHMLIPGNPDIDPKFSLKRLP